MDTVSFENERWPTYEQKVEFRHTAALSMINSPSILDIGPGDGLFLTLARNKFKTSDEMNGVDISIEAVRRCQEKGFDVELIDSADHLPYADNSFDTVVLLDVLEHTYNPMLILIEAIRVSSKYIVVGVPNFSSLPARMQTLRGEVPENNRPNKGHIYWFNRQSLEQVIEECQLTPVYWMMNTQWPFKLFAGILTRMFPNLFSLSFVVKLRKPVLPPSIKSL